MPHVSGVQKKDLEQIVDRYRCMPDYYYDGINAVSPEELGDDQQIQNKGYEEGKPVAMWEWSAGTGKLSTVAKVNDVEHLPPIDYRWGFDVEILSHQMNLLYVLLMYGCEVLFVSPNCTPWGSNSRQWTYEKRTNARRSESLALQFLTMVCFLQVLLGRTWVIEKPIASEILVYGRIQYCQDS